MATPEQYAMFEVRKRSCDWNARLFRNNSGMLKGPNGRPVRFGLGNESSKINATYKTGDYIGWTPVLVTPEMVGKTVAVFTSVEVKADGFLLKERYSEKSREFAQNNFNELVNANNGIAGFSWDWKSFDELIFSFHKRFKVNV
ncbi:MAG: hypothetical protein ACRC01_02545 [Deefgea sp.]